MYNRERSETTEQMLYALQEQACNMYVEINEMKVRFIRHLLSFYKGDPWIYIKEKGGGHIRLDKDGYLVFSHFGDDICVMADDLDPIITELSNGRAFTGKPAKDHYQNYLPLRRKKIKPLTFTIDITAPL